MEYIDYIKPELLVLIPVLGLIGLGFKRAGCLKDKHIPLYLGLIGVLCAVLYVFASSEISSFQALLMCIFVGFTQGVLCAGCSVYANQLYKQGKREDE